MIEKVHDFRCFEAFLHSFYDFELREIIQVFIVDVCELFELEGDQLLDCFIARTMCNSVGQDSFTSYVNDPFLKFAKLKKNNINMLLDHVCR